MQAKYGDYSGNAYQKGSINNEYLLPKRVMEQYRLSMEEWEKRIFNWWKDHQGLSK